MQDSLQGFQRSTQMFTGGNTENEDKSPSSPSFAQGQHCPSILRLSGPCSSSICYWWYHSSSMLKEQCQGTLYVILHLICAFGKAEGILVVKWCRGTNIFLLLHVGRGLSSHSTARKRMNTWGWRSRNTLVMGDVTSVKKWGTLLKWVDKGYKSIQVSRGKNHYFKTKGSWKPDINH